MPDAVNDLFSGLKALTETAFPRKCATCGRTYESAAEFCVKTEGVTGRSGLKASADDDGRSIIELYRNCECGSTMLEFFAERRDTSEQGLRRRERFGQLMEMLEKRGVARDVARAELLKVVRGQASVLLEELLRRDRKAG